MSISCSIKRLQSLAKQLTPTTASQEQDGKADIGHVAVMGGIIMDIQVEFVSAPFLFLII